MTTRLKIVDNKMSISLFKDEADSYMAKAMAKSQRYNNMLNGRKAPYGQNHPHSHYVGMVAEHATLVLMEEIEQLLNIDMKIDAVFLDDKRDKECDIVVNGLRIEVKCIKYGSWVKFGPCITAAQRKNIERKADVVLWAVYNERKQSFTFEGFNRVEDIANIPTEMTGVQGREKIENHPVMSIIKPLQEMQFC
ncbi:hypothetical protein EJP02_420 [Escherichia phage EJP2]|nr:hypothetical protein EJP02_420 [Escherichia phage EJP2]